MKFTSAASHLTIEPKIEIRERGMFTSGVGRLIQYVRLADRILWHAGLAGSGARLAARSAALGRVELPFEARLEFLPRGGMLFIRNGREHAVFLAERRCDLIAALLQPPTGVAPGDFVPDHLLIPRVWGSDSACRTQLNTLIHRTRQTLNRAGLDGTALIERAPGGRGTRFALAAHATVGVR